MKAKKGLLFLLLVLTIESRIKSDQPDSIRRRSGYQAFKAKQVNPSASSNRMIKEQVSSKNSNPENKTDRKLNTASKDYFDLINTGRPNRPKPGSQYHEGDECVLYAEFMPLYYNILTRTSDFTVGFSSNCLSYIEVNFKIAYKTNKLVNWFLHPNKVRLNLWGNQYRLKFVNNRLIDKFDINRAFEYRQIVISDLMTGHRRLKTTQRNMTYLDPQSQFTFNNFNVNKLVKAKGRVNCKLAIQRPLNYKRMLLKRMQFIELMRKKGEPDSEIRDMLKTKDFTDARKLQSSERKLVQNDRNLINDNKKPAVKKTTKRTRRKRTRTAKSDMTREERVLYNRNRRKMQVRLKRNFILGHEIICRIR
jgi:hypothetical protein